MGSSQGKLPRGFKAEAERLAAGIRGELGLTLTDRLDPFLLGKLLEIPIWCLRDLTQHTSDLNSISYLANGGIDEFSAMTIMNGYKRYIIYNEYHAATRQASDLAHEFSHCLLGHVPMPSLFENGRRSWDPQVEGEANCLGGTLLVPRDGAFTLSRAGMAIPVMAAHFGVSEKLCAWRVRQTGILRQIERLERYSLGNHQRGKPTRR